MAAQHHDSGQHTIDPIQSKKQTNTFQLKSNQQLIDNERPIVVSTSG